MATVNIERKKCTVTLRTGSRALTMSGIRIGTGFIDNENDIIAIVEIDDPLRTMEGITIKRICIEGKNITFTKPGELDNGQMVKSTHNGRGQGGNTQPTPNSNNVPNVEESKCDSGKDVDDGGVSGFPSLL